MIEKKIVKLLSSKVFIVFILTSLSVAIGLIFSGGRLLYETNDDYISSIFLSAGYDKNPYLNFFLHFQYVGYRSILSQ